MIEAAIRSILAAVPAITDLVADRIRPLYGAQGDARPLLTLQITDATGTLTHSGAAGSRMGSIEVGVIADSYSDAEALGAAIVAALHGYAGAAKSVRICPAVYEDETDIEQQAQPGKSTPVYTKTITFKARYIPLA